MQLAADGDTLAFQVTLRNTGAAALAGLRYMRVIDPDLNTDQDMFTTTNKLADRRTVTAGASGLTLTLASADPRASANVLAMPGDPSTDLAAALKAVGYSHKGDDTLHLVFDLGTLTAGAATSVASRSGSPDLDRSADQAAVVSTSRCPNPTTSLISTIYRPPAT